MAQVHTGRQEGTMQALAKRTSGSTRGRKSKFNAETLQKLEEAFAIGATDPEACFYAGVSTTAFYNYQEKHPKYVERKNSLKQRPVLLARQTVLNSIATDVNTAKWYLERKLKGEFSARTEVTGKDGAPVVPILGGASMAEDDTPSSKTGVIDIEAEQTTTYDVDALISED